MGLRGFVRKTLGMSEELDPEVKRLLTLGAASESTKNTMTEHEMDRILGIGKEMLHDTFLEGLMEAQSYLPVQAKIGEQVKELLEVQWDGLALRVLGAPVNATRVISQKEARLVNLYLESICDIIEMNMKEDSYEMGMSNFLDSYKVYIRLMLSDAIDGRKARLITTQQKRVELTTTTEGKGFP